MTAFANGVPPDNSDGNNQAARGLAMLAIVLAVIGAIIEIIGLSSSTTADRYGVTAGPNFAAVVVGAALLGSALSIWILLLVFWSWRFERRNHAIPTFEVDEPPRIQPSFEPSLAPDFQLPSLAAIQAAAAKTDTSLAVHQLDGSRIVTVTYFGTPYFLIDDVAVVLGTTVVAITKIGQQYGLAAAPFNYSVELGPDAVPAVGLFIPARSVPGLLKRLPAVRGEELLAFSRTLSRLGFANECSRRSGAAVAEPDERTELDQTLRITRQVVGELRRPEDDGGPLTAADGDVDSVAGEQKLHTAR